MAVKKPSTNSSKNPPSQPAVKAKSRKGSAGKKTKSAVLGDMTNADINALLATAAALQEKLQQQPELAAALDEDVAVSDLLESPGSSPGSDEDEEMEDEEMEGPNEPAEDTSTGTRNDDTLTVEGLKVALKELQEERDKLKAQLTSAESSTSADAVSTIPRPRGTAGTNFSIQESMTLAGSEKKDRLYRAIQRRVKDFMGFCKIEYDKTWKEIPAKVKSNLFEAVRNDQPYLARFQNDWATEELAKQYLKNKRKNAYKNGWLAVPTKYAHLKANAAQRSASGKRGSKAKTIRKAREQKKAEKAARKGRKDGLVGIAVDGQQ